MTYDKEIKEKGEINNIKYQKLFDANFITYIYWLE